MPVFWWSATPHHSLVGNLFQVANFFDIMKLYRLINWSIESCTSSFIETSVVEIFIPCLLGVKSDFHKIHGVFAHQPRQPAGKLLLQFFKPSLWIVCCVLIFRCSFRIDSAAQGDIDINGTLGSPNKALLGNRDVDGIVVVQSSI